MTSDDAIDFYRELILPKRGVPAATSPSEWSYLLTLLLVECPVDVHRQICY